MKTKLASCLFLSMVLLLTSCFPFNRVKGDGNLVTEEISIGDYDEIDISGTSAVVNYQQSDAAPALKVTTDKNIYDMYEFKTDGNKLLIRPKHDFRKSMISPTEFTVTTQSTKLTDADLAGAVEFNLNSPLKSEKLNLDAAGNGTMNLNDSVCVEKMKVSIAGKGLLNAPSIFVNEFKGETAGSGKLNLGGKAEEVKFETAGSGHINAFDLVATNLSCEIAGSGDADVNVSNNLSVSIAGRGSVRYKGNPANISKSIGGVGSVKQAD